MNKPIFISTVNRVAKKKGFTKRKFFEECMLSGLSWFAADKLWKDDPRLQLKTLGPLKKILEVKSISELIDFA